MSVLTSALALAFAEFRQSVRLNARVIAIYAAAILSALCGLGFGLAAIHRLLEQWRGPLWADLILGAALLFLALVLWLIGEAIARQARRKAASARLIAVAPIAAKMLFKRPKLGLLGLAAVLIAGGLAGRQLGGGD